MDNVSFSKHVSKDTFFDVEKKIYRITKGQSIRKGEKLTLNGIEKIKTKKKKKKNPWWYKDIIGDEKTDEECKKMHQEKLRKEMMVIIKEKVDFI